MKNAEWQAFLTERDPSYQGDSTSARPRIVQAWAKSLPSGKALDVGCADGALLHGVPGHHQVIGLDVSPVNLDKAKARGYVETIVHDCEQNLPFDAESFDLVVAAEVLEHVVDTDFVLREIHRVLRPSGHLITTVPNIRTPLGLAMLIVGWPPMFAARYQRGHVRDWTNRLIKEALRNNGFQVVQSLGTGMWLPKFGNTFAPLFRYLPGWSSTIATLSRKT